MLSVGIDIGGSSVKVAALDEGRTLWTRRSDPYHRPDAIALARAIAIAARGAGIADLAAVGLCVPGLLDSNALRVKLSTNVPGLVGIPLQGLVEEALSMRLPRPPQIVTDAYAAAHDIVTTRRLSAEWW